MGYLATMDGFKAKHLLSGPRMFYTGIIGVSLVIKNKVMENSK
ncbi:MAG: hypothetical protein AB8U44_03205 [Aaplasma endosymbiont of Hyalomma asiaticum]